MALLVSLTLVACTPDGEGNTHPAASSSQPDRWSPTATNPPHQSNDAEDSRPPEGAADFELPTPLAAYALTAREMATLTYARMVLWRSCMKRSGFNYPVSPFPDILASAIERERQTLGRLFGITDRETARVYGMLLPTTAASEGEPEEASDPAFDIAFRGPGDTTAQEPGSDGLPAEGGCNGEASQKLGSRNLMNFGDKARDLMFASSGGFQNSTAYQALQREWATCMAGAGYPEAKRTYNDPFTLQLVASRADPTKATPEEIEFALQSIDCMEEVDLQERALRLRAAFEQELLEEHQLELQENRKAMDEQVRRATEEIERAGGFK